jgi:hypothetical protein
MREEIAQFAVDQFKEFTAINHRVLMQQKVKSGVLTDWCIGSSLCCCQQSIHTIPYRSWSWQRPN